MSDVKPLHDKDFVAWSKEQAEALRVAVRSGSSQKLDWENLAEEVESLGFSERRGTPQPGSTDHPTPAEAPIFAGDRAETPLVRVDR